MEMICNITRNDETKLANALRSIYSSVVINEYFFMIRSTFPTDILSFLPFMTVNISGESGSFVGW